MGRRRLKELRIGSKAHRKEEDTSREFRLIL